MQKKLDPAKLTLGIKKEITKEHVTPSADKKIETVVKRIHEKNANEIETGSGEPTRRTTMDIPVPLHKKISHRALDKELTLKDYFLELAKKDLGEA